MRVVNVLDVIRCGKETSVVVKTSSGSAKIVPLNNRNWCDPKVKFSDSERGNLISLNTEASWDANAYVRIIGQISLRSPTKSWLLISRVNQNTATFRVPAP